MDYFCQVAGCRTVPVELGARYTDEEWSQKLMTVGDFIDRYIVNKVCYSFCFISEYSSVLLVQDFCLGQTCLEVMSREGVCSKHSSEFKGLMYFQDLKLQIVIAAIAKFHLHI